MLLLVGYISLGIAIAIPLLLLNVKVAGKLGLIDWPKARGISDEQIPIVGASLVLISLGVLFTLTQYYQMQPWLLLTGGFMAGMGLLDDRKPIPAIDKMFFQVCCAAAVVFLDPNIKAAMITKYGYMGAVVTFFAIVYLVNAINFIDGIDGLAGLVLIMGASGLIAFSRGTQESYPYLLYSAILIGTLIPFLFVNIKLRKGFLGNVGSYFFSHVLAVMHFSIPLEASSVTARFSLTALCFLIPVADSSMVIMSRLLTFRSPFQPDKGHLHHRLVQTSIPLKWILLNFGLIEVSGLTLAYLITRSSAVSDLYLPVFTCLSLSGITAVLILLSEKASKRRVQHYLERLDNNLPIYYFKYEVKNEDGSPMTISKLLRLEARVSSEIRVTDVCFLRKPNELYVCLSTVAEPLKGISARIDTVFQREKVQASLVIDHGQIIRVSEGAERRLAPHVPRKKAS